MSSLYEDEIFIYLCFGWVDTISTLILATSQCDRDTYKYTQTEQPAEPRDGGIALENAVPRKSVPLAVLLQPRKVITLEGVRGDGVVIRRDEIEPDRTLSNHVPGNFVIVRCTQ